MWERVVEILSIPAVQAASLSAFCVALGGVVYLLIRRRIRVPAGLKPSRTRLRLVGLGILTLLLLALVRIWTGAMFGPGRGPLNRRVQVVLENLLWTGAVGIVIYLAATTIRRSLLRSAGTIEDRHRIRMTTTWVGTFVFAIAAVFIWASGIKDFGVFLGIVGAGLALSLQETLLSVVGWLILTIRKPFDIGDRIEIDGRVGDVIGISAFQTTMMEVGHWVRADQSTGRMAILPNSMLVRHTIYNYSKGFPFVWNEFSTVVTFESDWRAAKELILAKAEIEADKIESEVKSQIQRMQYHYAIRYQHLRPIVYTSIAVNGVELTLRFLSPVRERRAMNHRISENVLEAFLAHPEIDFAYDTTRIFRNNEEGKSALRAPDPPEGKRPHAMG